MDKATAVENTLGHLTTITDARQMFTTLSWSVHQRFTLKNQTQLF